MTKPLRLTVIVLEGLLLRLLDTAAAAAAVSLRDGSTLSPSGDDDNSLSPVLPAAVAQLTPYTEEECEALPSSRQGCSTDR